MIPTWLAKLQIWWLYKPSRSELRLHKRFDELDRKLIGLQDTCATTNLALARIIAKLDPIYHINEVQSYNNTTSDDEAIIRANESDRIGHEVLGKLIAEENARRHTEGKPPLNPTELDYLRR